MVITRMFALSLAVTGAALAADAEVIIAEGQEAPGTGGLIVSLLGTPFTDGNGTVGFTGGTTDGDRFVWYDTGAVWLNSDGLPDVLTGAESTMGIGNAGEFCYSPAVNGNDAIVISQTGGMTIFQDTDPAPGFAGRLLTFCSRPKMNPDGTATWVAGLNDGAGGTSSVDRTLYLYDGTTATALYTTGDLVDGQVIDAPSGVGFSYDFSNDGAHHIIELLYDTGSTTNDGALIVDGVNVAQEGDPVPGGGENWDNFDDVGINDAGNWVATGDTDGATATDEILVYNGTIAVREGDTLDGTLIAGSLNAASINDRDKVAFIWNVTGVGEILYVGQAPDLLTTSIERLRTGDMVDLNGDTIDDAVITDFNASAVVGPGLDFANDGWVYLEVDVETTEGEEFEAIVRVRAMEPSDCPTDFDGGGGTGFEDLLVVLSNWGPCGGFTECLGDVDLDGEVAFSDLLAVLSNWGPCP